MIAACGTAARLHPAEKLLNHLRNHSSEPQDPALILTPTQWRALLAIGRSNDPRVTA
jgi:hypothetical protein